MRAIDFQEANTTFSKPDSMTDEQCSPLRAYVGQDEDVGPFIVTAWLPNAEDIDAILAGRPIVLTILSNSMPPVSLHTQDEYGEVNQ